MTSAGVDYDAGVRECLEQTTDFLLALRKCAPVVPGAQHEVDPVRQCRPEDWLLQKI